MIESEWESWAQEMAAKRGDEDIPNLTDDTESDDEELPELIENEAIDSEGFPIESTAASRQRAVEDKSKAKKKEEAFKDTTAKDIKRYADLMGVGGADDKVTKN